MQNFYTTMAREPFYELARPYIQTDSVVLDIGAGTGTFADYFSRDDFHLLDGNADTVDVLKNKFKNVAFGKLPKLPYENKSFNLIHCSHVIEHLQPQELYDTLKEIDRCLADDGILVISAPLMWEYFYNDLSHVKPYAPAVIEKYLCWGDESCTTRPLISSKYRTETLTFRTYRRELNSNIEIRGSKIVRKIILKVLSLVGATKIEKNGYTLILKKQK